MNKNRYTYSVETKAAAVLEVLAGDKTPQQIGIERGINPKTINGWVQDARQNMGAVFQQEKLQTQQVLQKEIDQLHQKIGQLTVENDFLKKASGKWK